MNKDINKLKETRSKKRNEYQQSDMTLTELEKRLKSKWSYRAGAITQIRNERETGERKKTRWFI